MVTHCVPKAKLRANSSPGNSQPVASSRSHNSLVVDIITKLPLPALVYQIRIHPFQLYHSRKSPGNVKTHDPTKPVRISRKVCDLEGHPFSPLKADLFANGVSAYLLAMHYLAVHLHDIVHGASIARAKLIDPCFFDSNEATGYLSSTAWIGRGCDPSKFPELQGSDRIQNVVVRFWIVCPLVNRNHRVDELGSPATTATIHFPGSHHV